MPKGQQTYQQIDPITGQVTNQFKGRVKADGLDLDSNTSVTKQYDLTTSIQWIRQSDGSVVADLQNYSSTLANQSDLILEVGKRGAAGEAQVMLHANWDNPAAAYVVANADSVSKKIIDALGRSDFLQLASGGALQVAWGTSAVTFVSNNTSGQVTILHGLQAVPQFIIITGRNPIVNRCIFQTETPPTNTQFTFKGYTSDSAVVSATQNCYWLAIG